MTTWEITFFDGGIEVGEFDFELTAAPVVGDVLTDDCGSYLVTGVRSVEDEMAAIDVEYLD